MPELPVCHPQVTIDDPLPHERRHGSRESGGRQARQKRLLGYQGVKAFGIEDPEVSVQDL